ncbi:MAG: hypothetical protein QOG63_1513, partial [Thermoleophilaceae bacterium]|nr:hypothetical protein [Thermoleophilaceae bacterium]
DENMTRYFMTIPEAVQLVIRAGSMGRGGEVYVLEMGDPVRIVDLARKMIQLSGREPDREVAIEFVGRRPGEKLHEDLFNPDEEPRATSEDKIMAAVRPPLDPDWVEEAFAQVEELVYAGDAQGLAATVSALAEARRLPDTFEAGAPASE